MEDLKIELNYPEVLNYAIMQCGKADDSYVELTSARELRNVTVVVSGDYLAEVKQRVDVLPAKKKVRIDELKVKPDADKLRQQTESTQTQISVSVQDAAGTMIASQDWPVRILAFNEWGGENDYSDVLAAFVTPNVPELSPIKVRTGAILKRLTGDSALDEYQTDDPNRARAQVAAVFDALRELGIVYSVPPASFEKQGQRLRLAPDVIKEKIGTCADLSVLMASVLESIGMHPLLIMIPGHMMVGCWLKEKYSAQKVSDDLTFLHNRTRDGVNEIVLVDAVSISSDNIKTFEQAVEGAEEKVASDSTPVTIVDVHRCRLDGLLPLPLPGSEVVNSDGVEHTGKTRKVDDSHYSIDEDDINDKPTGERRRKIWERKLLDFTMRNNLLNLRGSVNSLRLLTEDIGQVEDLLQKRIDLKLLPHPGKDDKKLIDDGLKHNLLYTNQSDKDLPVTVKTLFRASRNSLDENGANTLFLVLGTMLWYEDEKSVKAHTAPLLLMPVDLVRKAAGNFVLRSRDEDLTVNTTLLEYLRQIYGINIKGMDPLPQDDFGYDVDKILAMLRTQIKERPRWEVKTDCMLGLFSFSKFVMWNDIHTNFDKMAGHPVINALVQRQTLPDSPEEKEMDIRYVDEHVAPSELCVPIEADSSQLSAIAAAGRGRSFIMFGPPGTGKSQTITNIIANSLYHDKRVLFVAEKAAALQVVQRRLEGIGLAPFCLELHSNKATRAHVLEQLQQALDARHTVEPADFEQKSAELFEKRQHLQGYIDALHHKGSRGLSAYDCINGYEWLTGEPLELDSACIGAETTAHDIETMVQKIRSLQALMESFGSPLHHPLSGLRVTDESLLAGEKLKQGLKPLGQCLEPAISALTKIGASATLDQVNETCQRLDECEAVEQAKAQLLTTWTTAALSLQATLVAQEWESAKQAFFLVRPFKKSGFIKKYKTYNSTLTAQNADEQIEQLVAYEQMNANLSEAAVRAGMLSADQRAAVRAVPLAVNGLQPVAEIELQSLTEISAHLDTWMTHAAKARDWAYWCQQRQELAGMHLEPAAQAVLSEGASPSEAADRFLRAVYRKLAIELIDGSEDLRQFRGPVFEDSIRQYRQVAEEFRALSRKALYYHLVSRIPQVLSKPSASSEMGKLKRYITSRGRGMTIRKIFDEVPRLIERLCPCMLMSPISVAQYLSLENCDPFDIVIFDEASQMPTSEAVGTIARGKALVVAGDPKQMPPTSFFNVEATDETEAEYDDMESILDDCQTLSMPAVPLQWHYRSKSESLIAFSNTEYYDGKLYTFPSVQDRVSKVSYVPVEGTYDFGRTRSNKAEAEAIVSEVIRCWRDPELSKDSMGIVAFSKAQQDLIDDVLTQRIAGHADLEAMAHRENEGLFIKNLENVQGDERDVILFSIGYGPDKKGKVSMNFGPLNNKGGERRLNVAVSRARKEMMVFAILRPEQIDLKRSSAKGVEGLKRFLEFARSGQITVPSSQIAAQEQGSIVDAIAQEIRAMGYAVDANVGRSNFKVDIAVVDPSDKDRYLLGIMCDGENYYRTKTERDREIVQPGVLRSLGWRLMRLWSVDWFVNKEKELERIKKALTEPAPEPPEPEKPKEPEPEETDPEPAEPAPFSPMRHYEVADIQVRQSNYGWSTVRIVHHDELVSQLKAIVAKEQPVKLIYLCRRMARIWSQTRVTGDMMSDVSRMAGELAVPDIDAFDNSPVFWASQEMLGNYPWFRGDGGRKIDEIPAVEIDNALRFTVIQSVSIPADDLKRVAAQALGFARNGAKIDQTLTARTEALVADGVLKDENGLITL